MSNNAEAAQEEVSQQQQAANDQPQDTETAKQATPVKPQKVSQSELNLGEPEESRDSVVSAEGEESVEGGDEEAGDEEEGTEDDEAEAVAADDKKTNGHAGKNGSAAAKEAEVNGDAKNRKRSNIEEDGDEADVAQKKKRVEEADQPEVQAAAE